MYYNKIRIDESFEKTVYKYMRSISIKKKKRKETSRKSAASRRWNYISRGSFQTKLFLTSMVYSNPKSKAG